MWVAINPDLSGAVMRALVLQCDNNYRDCIPRWNKALDEANDNWIAGSIIVFASVVSEDFRFLLHARSGYNISDQILKDAPAEGDPKYPMFATQGKTWVSCHDVWVKGLSSLSDRDVENKVNCLDACYKLPHG